jgi:hypothetical protein
LGAPAGKKNGKELVLSTPVKMELEGYLAAEEDIKPPDILHHKGI